MTNERLLKKLNEIKGTMERSEYIKGYGLLTDLCKSIESDLRLDITKQTKGADGAKRQKSAEKYLKDNSKIIAKGYAQYSFSVNLHGEKQQCFMNNYTAFILNENGKLDLPEMPDNITPPNLLKVYEPLYKNNNIDITECFNINDIKMFAKSMKKADYIENPYVIETADGVKIGFNVGYLISIYEILGGNIKFYTGKNPSIKTLRCESENGTALICPVRLKK